MIESNLHRMEPITNYTNYTKMAAENFIFPHHSEPLFEAETSEFCCEMKFLKTASLWFRKTQIAFDKFSPRSMFIFYLFTGFLEKCI